MFPLKLPKNTHILSLGRCGQASSVDVSGAFENCFDLSEVGCCCEVNFQS